MMPDCQISPSLLPDMVLVIQENLRQIASFSHQAEQAALRASIGAQAANNPGADLSLAALELCRLNLGLTEYTAHLVRNAADLFDFPARSTERPVELPASEELKKLVHEAEATRQSVISGAWRLAATLRTIIEQLEEAAPSGNTAAQLQDIGAAGQASPDSSGQGTELSDIRTILSCMGQRLHGHHV